MPVRLAIRLVKSRFDPSLSGPRVRCIGHCRLSRCLTAGSANV